MDINKINLIKAEIANGNFLDCTYELVTWNYKTIHVWIKNQEKAITIICNNPKEVKEFRRLTGITKIVKQS